MGFEKKIRDLRFFSYTVTVLYLVYKKRRNNIRRLLLLLYG
nr:MAG TPA: hypothetical protein [Caudoviricetes sp.]